MSLISSCTRPLLLDFSINAPIPKNLYVRSCDVWGADYNFKSAPKISAAPDEKEVNITAQMAWSPNPQSVAALYATFTLLSEVKNQLLRSTTPWDKTVIFGAFRGVFLAVYIGDNLLNPSAVDALFEPLIGKISSVGIQVSKAAVIQVCGENTSSDQTFGVMVVANGTLGDVHQAAVTWSRSDCVDTTTFAESARLENLPVRIKSRFSPPGVVRAGTPTGLGAASQKTVSAAKDRLQRDVTMASAKTKQPDFASQASESTDHTVPASSAAEPTSTPPPGQCQTLKVFAGDTCDSLAKHCNISRQELEKFNPDVDLCKSTFEGQLVCCSAGEFPDVKPKKNADGYCFVYHVKATDTCESIAKVHGLDTLTLERLNYDTWGSPRQGKEKENETKSSDTRTPMKSDTSSQMGQCGVTEDFCISTQGSGSPGTGRNGTVACISNCGYDIEYGDPPEQFINVTYFDGYNLGRGCLNMDIKQVDKSYTHIHFTFGHINSDFGVEFKDEYSTYLFDQLTKLRGGPKRVLSFGGWPFSPKSSFYPVFRDGIKPQNRERFASSISKFADITGLDGVDFVWETPG
ncbi:hypothetical protein E4U42_001275, partial [Claviceps africana]